MAAAADTGDLQDGAQRLSLFALNRATRVFVTSGATDLRLSFNGLYAQVVNIRKRHTLYGTDGDGGSLSGGRALGWRYESRRGTTRCTESVIPGTDLDGRGEQS